jgi:anti-anti-sigma factor
MNDASLTIERQQPEGAAELLELRGELDLTNASSLDGALGQTSAEIVFVDVAALTFIDSAGIRALDQAHRKLLGGGRRLLIIAPSDSRAASIFRIAGFADSFVVESLDLALRELDSTLDAVQ